MVEIRLSGHPGTNCTAVTELSVELNIDSDGGLLLCYRLCGDLSLMRLPEPQPPASADNLWQHTCFEAFIAVAGETAYREYNFSPSGLYAGYAFESYRNRCDWSPAKQLPIAFARTDGVCRLEAVISPANLPVNLSGKPWQLGLSAVLQAQDGTLSYWALHHPVGRPDFHHPGGWILSINS